jgi:hypothetical protein
VIKDFLLPKELKTEFQKSKKIFCPRAVFFNLLWLAALLSSLKKIAAPLFGKK